MAAGWSIVAVDPGTNTGLVYCLLGERELRRLPWRDALALCRSEGRLLFASVTTDDEQITTDKVMAFGKKMEQKGRYLSGGRVPQISDWVIEDFILQERTMDRSLLSPVRITEGIERSLHIEGSSALVTKYMASDAKGVISNQRLKNWGWLKWTVTRHERDALRHLCLRVRELKLEVGNGHA